MKTYTKTAFIRDHTAAMRAVERQDVVALTAYGQTVAYIVQADVYERMMGVCKSEALRAGRVVADDQRAEGHHGQGMPMSGEVRQMGRREG